MLIPSEALQAQDILSYCTRYFTDIDAYILRYGDGGSANPVKKCPKITAGEWESKLLFSSAKSHKVTWNPLRKNSSKVGITNIYSEMGNIESPPSLNVSSSPFEQEIHMRNAEGWGLERDARIGPSPSLPFPMTTPCRAGEANRLHPAMYHMAIQRTGSRWPGGCSWAH